MTFDPKTFHSDLRAAQRWMESQLPQGASSYGPSININTGYNKDLRFTITNNWMQDSLRVEGVDLPSMMEELKRRLGFEAGQLEKMAIFQIEGKAK